MERTLAALAIVGLVLMIVGRLLLWGAAAHMGTFWLIAIRFLPLGDVAFLIRHWDMAKNGAITSIIGMAFLLPFVGHELFKESTRERPAPMYQRAGEIGDLIRMSGTSPMAQNERLQWKSEKVDTLNAYLATWYKMLQERREQIKGSQGAGLAQYNLDAAAYKDLLSYTKRETDELNALRGSR